MNARIENGEIVITIDVAALVSAVEHGPIGDDHPGIRVVDSTKLARWVITRIAEEDEEAPRLGLLIEEQIGEALNYGELPEDMGIDTPEVPS